MTRNTTTSPKNYVGTLHKQGRTNLLSQILFQITYIQHLIAVVVVTFCEGTSIIPTCCLNFTGQETACLLIRLGRTRTRPRRDVLHSPEEATFVGRRYLSGEREPIPEMTRLFYIHITLLYRRGSTPTAHFSK